MKSEINLWQFVGFTIVSFLGTILHFLYDWTDLSFIALFSSVNESTFEHMKILFFPMFLFAIVQSFFVKKEFCNYWCIKLQGCVIALLLIPVLFYTLSGIFGKLLDFINILIFFTALFFGVLYETKQFKKPTNKCSMNTLCLTTLILISIVFMIFTFYPPHIPLFLDPITKTYGFFKSV